jgi:membrane-bound lytic murein transglycosylase D
MRLPLFSTLFFFAFFQFVPLFGNISFNREEIKSRVTSMKIIVNPRFTSTVEGYIKGYFARGTTKANIIMGRAIVYFPIYEKYLEQHALPKDLKYLSVLESALNPVAVSPVGAGGLWQFMRETGKAFGLDINANVDERSCAHRSTEAAMKYLARQFDNYGNWELALAAYNCGAGNLNKAIRRARTNDYWKLAKYIPRETSNFIPAFIGAAYMVNYGHTHNVEPRYPSLDMQLVEEVPVYTNMDFNTIAAITSLPFDVVSALNPTFKRGFVPENPKGYFILLPKRVVGAFREYQEKLRPDNAAGASRPAIPDLIDSSNYKPEEYYTKSTYIVAEGDNIDELAKLFNCSSYHLQAWNNLSSVQLTKGQELHVWFSKDAIRIRERVQRNNPPPPAPKKPQRPKPMEAIPLSTISKIEQSVPVASTTDLLLKKTADYKPEISDLETKADAGKSKGILNRLKLKKKK